MLRGGVTDAPGLAAELSRRSGVDELRRCIDVYFVQRSTELKAHSIVLAALRLARQFNDERARAVIARAEEHLAEAHSFRELQLIGRVVARRVDLPEDHLLELERVLGGQGTSVVDRLGPGAEDLDDTALQLRALERFRRWDDLASNPLLPPDTVEACQVAARSCEALLATVVSQSGAA